MQFDPTPLIEARRHQRMSAADLATHIGRGPMQVWRYESGNLVPQADVLGRWLTALNVDVTAVFRKASQ